LSGFAGPWTGVEEKQKCDTTKDESNREIWCK